MINRKTTSNTPERIPDRIKSEPCVSGICGRPTQRNATPYAPITLEYSKGEDLGLTREELNLLKRAIDTFDKVTHTHKLGVGSMNIYRGTMRIGELVHHPDCTVHLIIQPHNEHLA